jgi:lysozyme
MASGFTTITESEGMNQIVAVLKVSTLVIIACYLTGCSSENAPSPDTVKAQTQEQIQKGIDISHFQGDLLQKIGSGQDLQFVICKATEGVDYVDPKFYENWSAIKAKGWVRGAYHFYVSGDDPQSQANHFADVVKEIDIKDIAPIVDVEQLSLGGKEVSVGDLQAGLLVFLGAIEKKFDRKPMIYTSYNFAQVYLNDAETFGNYDLWLAEYSGDQKPKIPDAWAKNGFKIWQRSDSYKIDSIDTDSDVYYGDINNLSK